MEPKRGDEIAVLIECPSTHEVNAKVIDLMSSKVSSQLPFERIPSSTLAAVEVSECTCTSTLSELNEHVQRGRKHRIESVSVCFLLTWILLL